jgi:hypothetical protein
MPARNNIFVIGDLVIDHTVIVKDQDRETGGRRPGLEVVRRVDTAGGAANCARILATLNPGYTFLWGLIGNSIWGDFRRILEHSQAIDGSTSAIKFRGVMDETRARMNTISRVIKLPHTAEGQRQDILRFDDHGHIHVPEDKRRTALTYLERVHQKYTVHGVLFSDLDMNCLKADQLVDLSTFCKEEGIPLFVNPGVDSRKYKGIHGSVILASLDEWLALVESDEPKDTWLGRLDHIDGLIRMAQISLEYLNNFKYQVLLCGASGSVIIVPHERDAGKYLIYKAEPPGTEKPFAQMKLGSGDIMSAVFAMEFSSSPYANTEAILGAFAKANSVVGCFQDTLGPRMPSFEVVQKVQQRLATPVKKTEVSAGVLFLPNNSTIRLSDPNHATGIPTLYSADPDFQQELKRLVQDIREAWESNELRSIILGAPSGTGKTTILNELKGDWGKSLGVHFDVIPAASMDWTHSESFLDSVKKQSMSNRVLLGFDEAWKAPIKRNLQKYGVTLLNEAHARDIRFLLVSAEFKGDNNTASSEFSSRCRTYYLPSLDRRLGDIPYIIGGMLVRHLGGVDLASIKVERSFLIALTNKAVDHPNLRKIDEYVETAVKAARKEFANMDDMVLSASHLPKEVRDLAKDDNRLAHQIFEYVTT